MEKLSSHIIQAGIRVRDGLSWRGTKNGIPNFKFYSSETEIQHDRQNFLQGITDQIALNKIPCLFVSPHLDDAVLSAGEYICELARKTEVSVATIFTKPDPELDTTWSQKCGFNDVDLFYNVRQSEDLVALSRLGIKQKNIHHLGFAPTYRRPESQKQPDIYLETEKSAIDDIRTSITNITAGTNYMVFFPNSRGRKHMDHQLTRKIGETFSEAVFWEEFREIRTKGYECNDQDKLIGATTGIEFAPKIHALSAYQSQLKSVFPNANVTMGVETFYFPKKH
jgi:LmbE family N-acetylglucosaminyl deacetylase